MFPITIAPEMISCASSFLINAKIMEICPIYQDLKPFAAKTKSIIDN